MKKTLEQAIKFEQFDEHGIRHTRHEWGGHTWELVFGEEAYFLLCLDPDIDDDGVDWTNGPDDVVVSGWAGVPLEFSDAGDNPDYPEAIYHRSEISKAAATLGQKGGRVKTAAKAKAARENGRKGGRPKGSGKKKKEYDR